MAITDDFYDCTWGSVRLWCSRIETDNSRTQVIHELAEGDEHPTQDRGLTPGRPVVCELLWVDMPREATPPLERFLAFKKLVDNGEGPLLFVHPIDGGYYANVSDFKYTLDEDGNVESCSVTFIRTAPASPPVAIGTGTSIFAGEQAIELRAAALESALADLESSDYTIGADAIAAQAAWMEPDDVPTQQVIADVADLSTAIADMIEAEGLEDDLAKWDAYVAAIGMGDAIRSAALAALAETPRLTAILVRDPVSVLALAVRIYGGGEAIDRVRQILALNGLRSPAWIEPGTVITVPLPTTKQRRQMRAA